MILAWENKADSATITAGSQIATLPAANLQNVHVAKKWHSAAGVKATHLLVDMGEPVQCSMLALLGSNLSSAATVRLRASLTDAEADAALEVDTGKMPARAKAGYGAVYKHIVKGKYLSLASDETPSLAFDLTARHVAAIIGQSVVSVARAGAQATRVNELGLIEIVAADTPRFDHDPDTLECKGLLIEPTRTNIAWPSSDLSHANWAPGGGGGAFGNWNLAAVTPNAAVAPNGAYEADRLTANAAPTSGRTSRWTVTPGATYTATQYFKRVSGGGFVAFAVHTGLNNALVTPQFAELDITNFSSSKYTRASVTFTVPAAGVNQIEFGLYFATGNGSFLAWGADLVEAPSATSHIPTTTGAITREGDLLTTPVGPWFNQSAGTLVAEWISNYTAGNQRIAYLGNAVGGERSADLFVEANADSFDHRVGGIGSATIQTATGPIGTVRRIAGAYAANDFAMGLNGALAGTDNSGPISTGSTELALGQFGGGGAGIQLNGHLRRITYYPKRISNAKLSSGTGSSAALVEAVNIPTARYWRIDIEDTTLDDNIQVGRLFLGPSWETPQSQGAGLEYGWGVTPDDPSEEEESAGGQTYPEERPQRRVLACSLDWGTEQEMYENAFAMARAAGVVRDVLAIPQEDSAYISEQAVWGQLRAPQPIVHRTSRTFRQQFTVRERL